jgi:hypothetical protein
VTKTTKGKKAGKPALYPIAPWTEEQEEAAFYNLALFRQHPLVINHGCSPSAVIDAYITAGKARRELNSPRHGKNLFDISDPLDCAKEVFWRYDHLPLWERFLNVSMLLKNNGRDFNPDPKEFLKTLGNARRRKAYQETLEERVGRWMSDNWVRGDILCILSVPEIAQRADTTGLFKNSTTAQGPEKFIEGLKAKLGLKSAKTPGRGNAKAGMGKNVGVGRSEKYSPIG